MDCSFESESEDSFNDTGSDEDFVVSAKFEKKCRPVFSTNRPDRSGALLQGIFQKLYFSVNNEHF